MKINRVLAAAAVPVLAVLTACSSGSGDQNAIRIGTTEASDRSWELFEEKAADAGITLEVVNFSDYSQPNTALSQGQIDVNLFQHLQFLGEYNVGADDDLTPIGATQIVPLGLYCSATQQSTTSRRPARSRSRTIRAIRRVPSSCSRAQVC
ncbi:hypothetical protein Rrhod_4428 [Rhodococcus rhodnii LMG 5362]|uniref:Methionine ABC transporter substrate-binding protein n=1 Tax=Rhodococcus rhodnii LMG 5362 TaxID=1273125 RepID=R7WJW9_9NOCA|nr:hypothetical protein Rrhod_4428 [Rhodococcus rhodnii LMG 5362]